MADLVKCPVCGESTPSNLEFCQHCQSRLQPSTGSLNAPIRPGQFPTKKNTADLEPILPQWLRDARDSARSVEPQESSPIAPKPEPTRPAPHAEDLLAGLQSQSSESDEDETPDWLASITGAAPKPKKPQTESTEARWVEMGGKDDFAKDDTPSDVETPSWLAGLQANETQADEKDELTDWFRNAADEPKPAEQATPLSSLDDSSSFSSVSSDDTPDWLRQMAADEDSKKSTPSLDTSSNAFPPEVSETPDWLRQMTANDKAQQPPAQPADAPELSLNTPDWLRGIQDVAQSADSAGFEESTAGESEAFDLSSNGDLPDWLKQPSETPSKPAADTTPKWLKSEEEARADGEVPAWLSSSEERVYLPPTPESENAAKADEDILGDLPDWLKAAAPQASIFEPPATEKPTAQPEPAEAPAESPDWLEAFKSVDVPEAAPSAEKESPFEVPPIFAEVAPAADDLFTEMPDWLSNAMELPASSSPTPITNTDAIAPGELPTWVQAMRPVDAPMPSLSASFPSDQTLESRGALAGLQGVLPAAPGFTPTSKPKAYSIRLHASEEQLAHAELLEQILTAETAPVPIASYSALRGSRSLRWFLVFVILMAVAAGLFLPASAFSMPVGVPREVGGALDVSRNIPENAPVLVAVDYEASRVGEMEAAAAPFFDQMILLKHPRLTFISTNEIGAILAERLVSGPLGGHNYESGITYLNLGYLPGGQLGIRAFAQNPHLTSPFAQESQVTDLLDISPEPAWTSAPLAGVNSLSQFAALVLITDNAESARMWIEQTESTRGSVPLVVISSAQAAPMIQPYYESRQVNGMVAGLYGGAVFEQNNAGRPGTARNYWNAYNLGMLLAMSLVLGGGLWSLALGLRDHAAARETI